MRVLVVAVLVAAFVRGEQVKACGGWAPDPADGLTFDPNILEDEDGALYYEPWTAGFGASGCAGCNKTALLADWKGYLRETGMTDAEWERILFQATGKELAQLATKWKNKDKVAAAIALVRIARRVEPIASLEIEKAAAESADVLADAKAAFGKAKDPFMQQRYAFQIERVLFYQHDWPGAIAWFDNNDKVLAGPSTALAAEARYYTAGALVRSSKLARANLELARVHATDHALAAAAAQDFKPQNDADWKDALALAKTTGDKVALWRLVGLKHDGVVAMQEIVKLDPKSPLIGLLMVRELAKSEGTEHDRNTYQPLEKLAADVIAKGGDKPWLMELVLGHIAARRGDLAHAREHLKKAVDGQPKNARVASQARASLAIALAANWQIDSAHEDELAKSLAGIAKEFQPESAVTAQVRVKLAKLYAAAGKLTDAEMLVAGTSTKWNEVSFIKDMIARASKQSTAFDKFVVGWDRGPSLQQDLALRYLVDGDFATSSKTFASTNATSQKLGTDPFVIHIIDCHDCDHEKYANAAWTHASVVQKLVELEKIANGKDEAAADAAMQIGNVLYNITWYGNARAMLETSHQQTRDSNLALKWYKRAFELTKTKEKKAQAAFLASKAELGVLLSKLDPYDQPYPLPVPTTWFTALKKLDDTKYYKDVLKECGAFHDWAGKHK